MSTLLRTLALLLAPGVASLHIVFGAHNIPHPQKEATGGEDAFFFDDRLGTFGIADGVGGSRRGNVDPGEFSREVLRRCYQSTATSLLPGVPAYGVPKLMDVLRIASTAPIALGGSTTLVLGQLEAGTDELRLINLGDSGAMLLRPSLREFGETQVNFPRCVLRSQDQSRGFNWPFQASAKNFGAVGEDIDVISTLVRDGDVVIAATDGVLDNVFDRDLQAVVSEELEALAGEDPTAAQESVSRLARSIAERAAAIGLRRGDAALKTPFAEAAAEEGVPFKGGKLDDVAIVCGVVRDGAPPAQRVAHNFDGVSGAPPPVGVVVPTAPVWEAAAAVAASHVVPPQPSWTTDYWLAKLRR